VENEIKIVEITEMSQEVLDAFALLTPQLSSSASIPTWDELDDLIRSKASILLAAMDSADNDRIVGSLTLAVFRLPTGIRSWIEDVVVDSNERGKGIGEKLVRAAIERAHQEGAKTVDLTSRPSREAANRLYRRCGFETRETNIYRFIIEQNKKQAGS
jgi:ribosomal protein S18 acetylase RimI-like enzyme